MQTAPSYLEGFTNGSDSCKEIFDQVRKDLDCGVLFWTKTSQRLTVYIYYPNTNNIHIVLESLTFPLIVKRT